MRRVKLIAFDLDGVLVDGLGSWRELHNSLGTEKASEVNYRDFYAGRINFDEWARRDVRLWEGIEIERVEEIFSRIPLMPGAKETLSKLNKRYKTAIISGGLQRLVDRVKDELEIDYAIGNKLICENGRICGIENRVDLDGKGKILEKIATEEGISTKECAAIGDYFNDIPMFKVAGFRIAFNPKDEITKKYADEVVYGKDLTKILRFFE